MPQRHKHRFTLLELITAIVVAAVLLTPLLGALQSALTLRDRREEATGSDVRRQRALDTLKHDLTNMVPAGTTLAGDVIGEQDEEDGCRQDSLAFATAGNPPQHDRFGTDILRVTYAMAETEDGERYELLRSTERNLLALETEDAEEEILIADIRAIEFSYYNGEEWLDSWDTSLLDNQLPEAVAVHLELPVNENTVEIVDLTVPVPVSGSSSETGGDQP